MSDALERLADAGISDPRSSSTRIRLPCPPPTAWAPTLWSCTPANTPTRAGDAAKAAELGRILDAAVAASETRMSVHAGHGLTYENVVPVAALPHIEELNIGHSVVSRAVFTGLERAVREMKATVQGAPARVARPGAWVPPVGF